MQTKPTIEPTRSPAPGVIPEPVRVREIGPNDRVSAAPAARTTFAAPTPPRKER
jgi:hypothetical protein